MNRIFLPVFFCLIFMTVKINCQNTETNEIETGSLGETLKESFSGIIGGSLKVEFTFSNRLFETKPYRCCLCKPNHESCDKTSVYWGVYPEGTIRKWKSNHDLPILSKSLSINPPFYPGIIDCSFKFNDLTLEHNGDWTIIASFWSEKIDGLLNISSKKYNFTITVDNDESNYDDIIID
ncbi:hypothetical protein HCN44_004573 [Aphidius gifuensis]|uniref:DUF3859 domain-containing protein n=1 Tax=Aphidius gifuensis TaxID=684658 RepID=A0A834Y204_APHGI|nr:hypothetical protein HCN44_004573 [Aphidius gifuensis]